MFDFYLPKQNDRHSYCFFWRNDLQLHQETDTLTECIVPVKCPGMYVGGIDDRISPWIQIELFQLGFTTIARSLTIPDLPGTILQNWPRLQRTDPTCPSSGVSPLVANSIQVC